MPLTAQRGMINHTTNLCYRLSLLQALLHLPIFVNWVLDYLHPENCKVLSLTSTSKCLT